MVSPALKAINNGAFAGSQRQGTFQQRGNNGYASAASTVKL